MSKLKIMLASLAFAGTVALSTAAFAAPVAGNQGKVSTQQVPPPAPTAPAPSASGPKGGGNQPAPTPQGLCNPLWGPLGGPVVCVIW